MIKYYTGKLEKINADFDKDVIIKRAINNQIHLGSKITALENFIKNNTWAENGFFHRPRCRYCGQYKGSGHADRCIINLLENREF